MGNLNDLIAPSLRLNIGFARGISAALNGNNCYFGGKTLTAGTLMLGNSSDLESDGLTINDGTLNLNGNSISVAQLTSTNCPVIC